MNNKFEQGFTLIELMIVIVIIGILAAFAVPSFTGQIETRRVKGVAEGMFSSLQNTKAEAVKVNESIRIVILGTSNATAIDIPYSTWCYGMTTDTSPTTCDCTVADGGAGACYTGSVVQSTSFQGITIEFDVNNSRGFNPLRGTATTGDALVTFSSGNKTLGVHVSTLGRIKVCEPSGSTIISQNGVCP